MPKRLLHLLLLLVCASPLFARDKSDVVIMKNGDHFTCEVKGLDADVLYVSLDYALGTISMDWSKVDHIESKQLFIVKTQEGLVYSGTLNTVPAEGKRPIQIHIVEPGTAEATLDKDDVIKMDETSAKFWQRFSGEIGFGSNYSKGNETAQYSLNTDVNYPRERWAAGASFNSTLSSSTGTNPSTRNEVGATALRLVPWNNWYYSGLADFLQSSEQGIQLQSTFGGGIGRYFINSNRATISVVGGAAWQNINYSQAQTSSTTQRVTSAMITGNVKLFYFNKTTLNVNASLLPALSEPGRVHFNLNTSYYVKLWSNLTFNITFYGNWDNRPPPGFSSSDYGTSSGLSWTFGNH